MDIYTLIELHESFDELGGGAQGELLAVLDGADMNDLNRTALKRIVDFLRKAADAKVEGPSPLLIGSRNILQSRVALLFLLPLSL